MRPAWFWTAETLELFAIFRAIQPDPPLTTEAIPGG